MDPPWLVRDFLALEDSRIGTTVRIWIKVDPSSRALTSIILSSGLGVSVSPDEPTAEVSFVVVPRP